jgi:hypothetical protein
LRLLDELRMLTNLSHGGQPLVRLVLAGGCSLEERFASPKLDSFNQRIAARCYLQPLGRTETQQYIHARLDAVTQGSDLFSDETCDAVHRVTDGVPRLINQVCDHALVLAYADGRKQLEPAHIEEAWADLQQLPTRCGGETPSGNSDNNGSGASTIEFGSNLDSFDDASAETDQPSVTGSSEPETAMGSEVPMSSFHISPDGDGIDNADGADGIDSDDASLPRAEAQLHRIEQMLSGAEDDFRPAGSIRPEVELIFEDPAHPFDDRFQEEEVVADRYTSSRKAKTHHQPGLTPPRKRAAVRLDPPDAAGGRPAPETVSLCRPEDIEAAEIDDADMVIVEDGYDDRAALDVCPIISVRHLEYGQLFARLRRG